MDDLNELKELGLHYARGIWKNRWIAIAIAWVVLLVGVAGVDQIKYLYKAETKVYIDSTSVLGPLLRGIAVQSDFKAVVKLMAKQLLSRPNLERAVRAVENDRDVNTEAKLDALTEEIRSRVSISAQKRSGIYTISYTDIHRIRARKIVQALLDIFVADTLGNTTNQSDKAIKFLDQQIEKYEGLLTEAERRREEFKRENLGMMPRDGNDYFRQLQNALSTLEQEQLVLSQLRNRRNRIAEQIAELKISESESRTVVKSSLDLRIEEQEKSLFELLLIYTEEHPDAINARHVLIALRSRKEQEAAQFAKTTSLLDNPVYQEQQIALGRVEADISSVGTRVFSLESKAKELRERIDIVPQIEAQLQRLDRDYEVNRKNYTQLVSRREQARIAEDAEADGEKVKIRILEPPYVPIKPQFPNKPLFDLAIVVLSIGIGYGIAFLISLMQPVFYNQRELMKIIGGTVLGGISKFDTPDVLRKRRRNVFLFTIANLLFFGTAGVLIYLHTEGVLILSSLQMMVM
jgi:polysaccharide chain length determinant protein (PEP-CTERM system associated)